MMTKKKISNGFTLVELLAVISLLAVVALITIPAITSNISKQSDKLYYDQLNQLIRAGQNWGTDHINLLSSLSGNCDSNNWYKVSLTELQTGSLDVSYLADDFTNPRTDENFDSADTFVYVYKQNKSYLYCVMSSDCNNTKYEEYKETASSICCDGEDFQNRIGNCSVDVGSING